mmetsp:Transcript_32733/g.79342  ORF Transcript_32733/g.79342 Transcript_32733/m.79342 type:complete len:213 (+) Transcript_32733:79-717(+)
MLVTAFEICHIRLLTPIFPRLDAFVIASRRATTLLAYNGSNNVGAVTRVAHKGHRSPASTWIGTTMETLKSAVPTAREHATMDRTTVSAEVQMVTPCFAPAKRSLVQPQFLLPMITWDAKLTQSTEICLFWDRLLAPLSQNVRPSAAISVSHTALFSLANSVFVATRTETTDRQAGIRSAIASMKTACIGLVQRLHQLQIWKVTCTVDATRI